MLPMASVYSILGAVFEILVRIVLVLLAIPSLTHTGGSVRPRAVVGGRAAVLAPVPSNGGKGGEMIASSVVAEVRRLLAKGHLSQREIARWTGVSRGTVNAIARGKRRDDDTRRHRQDEGFIPPSGPARRCPGCGGLVQMPCLVCQVRALKEDRRSMAV